MLFTLSAPGDALAHRTSLATGEVHVSGDLVAYRLRVSAHDLAVALGIETDLITPVPAAAFESQRAALERYLAERVTVTTAEAPCAPDSLILDDADLSESLVMVLRYHCPATVTRLGIRYALFFDLDPTHRSVGRVVVPGRDEPFVFDRSLGRLDLDVTGPPASGWAMRLRRLFVLGIEHIATGYDHLLFLLALLLASPAFWRTVKIVTAFTVAHSLTLALAWSCAFAPPPRLVETAVAASVAYVALENVIARGGSHRWVVAGGFGLVHGLGFYGALRDSGLEGASAVTSLLAFNLGVETGQVALVALAYGPLIWWTRQRGHEASARVGSAAILVVALWWVIERAVGR